MKEVTILSNADQPVGILDLLGYELPVLMEVLYEELGLAYVYDNEALIRTIVENPILIERPIVIHGGWAATGLPPQSVLSVLE